jgi:hypothetical protein
MILSSFDQVNSTLLQRTQIYKKSTPSFDCCISSQYFAFQDNYVEAGISFSDLMGTGHILSWWQLSLLLSTCGTVHRTRLSGATYRDRYWRSSRSSMITCAPLSLTRICKRHDMMALHCWQLCTTPDGYTTPGFPLKLRCRCRCSISKQVPSFNDWTGSHKGHVCFIVAF